RAALLVNGSDHLFRALIGNLMTMSHQLQALRAHLARRLGVSEPEYRIFLAIAQLQGEGGVSVGTVARHLAVSGAFVTMIVQRLVKSGHVAKRASVTDRRGVLLRLTAKGGRIMMDFAAEPQAINDELFADLSRSDFRLLADLAERIVAGGERALAMSRLQEAALRSRPSRNPPGGGKHGASDF
ncbi:MAG: winged helix-turn-helix transcriptional regulator, partial [Alphaproteobacteria bacterium]|nr:winged helix-turn-helix transcriptional regulator [Alphaproteobacteria bacterium]